MIRSFQDCRLYPDLSVEDVLMVCEDAVGWPVSILGATLQLPMARRSERRKREAVDRVIGAFGLGRFRHHRAAEISTGTRRVVDLASVVLAEPRLLLLDEPTAGIAQREAVSNPGAFAAANPRMWPTVRSCSWSTMYPLCSPCARMWR